MSRGPGQDRKSDRLAELDKRITAARDAGKPKPRPVKEEYEAASYAWRMVIELVMGILIGGAMGYGLDSFLGTLPAFLIVFVLLGFAAGVRTMMRSAEEMQRRRSKPPRENEEG